MNTSKYYHRLAASAALTILAGMAGISSGSTTVVVSPTNFNGWTLNTFDSNGDVVTGTGGPYDGTAAMVTGPATPPLGVGSAELATPAGMGDGGAAIATDAYDGTYLSSITSLSYSAYDVTNNGQQFPYLAISINTGAVDNSGDMGADANQSDTLYFEPPYQQPSTGNPSLANQGATVQNVWQPWNAYVGGFWDEDSLAGMNIGGGYGDVQSLSTFLADFPDAQIVAGGYAGLGGIALQVGFGSPGDTEVGYVDDFTIGVNGVNTTYDFEPASVPEPASFSILGLGALALLRRRRRRA